MSVIKTEKLEINQSPESVEIANIFKTIKQLDCGIANTLRTVNEASSNLLNEIEFIAHGKNSENSLPIERESASYLINLKAESTQLLNHFADNNTPELDKSITFGSFYKRAEDLERYSVEINEFNRYLKMLSQGFKKMVSNNQNHNSDYSHLGSISSTVLSEDFTFGNPVASSPFSSPVFKHHS